MTCLDPAPFAVEGIAVVPFLPPTADFRFFGRRISALWALVALGPQDLAARIQRLALNKNQDNETTDTSKARHR